MLRLLITVLFSIVSFVIFAQQNIKGTDLKFKLPNESWIFSGEQTTETMEISVFKRTPIKDSNGRNVVANFSIIKESSGGYDVVTYSAIKRGEMPPFEVEQVFIPKDIKMKYKNGIGYLASYSDQYGMHKVYILFLKQGDIGARIICDVTEELFDEVQEEFLLILRSIK